MHLHQKKTGKLNINKTKSFHKDLSKFRNVSKILGLQCGLLTERFVTNYHESNYYYLLINVVHFEYTSIIINRNVAYLMMCPAPHTSCNLLTNEGLHFIPLNYKGIPANFTY